MKIEEIRKINEEIENIKINNLKENNEHQKRKTDLDESNKLLLQLLMQTRQEKKTLMGKISSLEKEILKSKEQILKVGEELKISKETVSGIEQKDKQEMEIVDDIKQENEKEPFEDPEVYEGKTTLLKENDITTIFYDEEDTENAFDYGPDNVYNYQSENYVPDEFQTS